MSRRQSSIMNNTNSYKIENIEYSFIAKDKSKIRGYIQIEYDDGYSTPPNNLKRFKFIFLKETDSRKLPHSKFDIPTNTLNIYLHVEEMAAYLNLILLVNPKRTDDILKIKRGENGLFYKHEVKSFNGKNEHSNQQEDTSCLARL